MNTKNKSTENCCKSCVWKWFLGIFKWLFGKSSGTFLLGIGTVIAAYQLSPVLEKITEVKKVLEELQTSNNKIKQTTDENKQATDEIKQATYEIIETIKSLKNEQKSKSTDSIIKPFTQQTQSIRDLSIQANILRKNIETKLGAATKSSRPWEMHISNEKINDLIQKFKQNPSDLAGLKNELFQSIETSSDSPKQNDK